MIDFSKLQIDQRYTFPPLTESIFLSAGQDEVSCCYGPYVFNGKQRYRNYHRALKTSTAISFIELFEMQIKKAHEQGVEMLRKALYVDDWSNIGKTKTPLKA